MLVGEPEKALDKLEPLLKIPYYLSPGWLKIDLNFDPAQEPEVPEARRRGNVIQPAGGAGICNLGQPDDTSAGAPVSDPTRSSPARRGRDGRGLPGAGQEAGSGRRDQGPAAVRRERSRHARPVRARGEGGRGALASEHPRDPRLRRPRRHRLRRHGASGRRDAAREARHRTDPQSRGGRLRPSDCEGPLRRPRKGGPPPRSEARERVRDEGRPRQDSRFRPGEESRGGGSGRGDERGDRLQPHAARNRDGNDGLHVSRAGAGASGRSPFRHLLFRNDPLRAARGQEGFPTENGERHDGRDPAGRAAGAVGFRQKHLARPGPHRPALPGEEPEREVPVGQGHRLRAVGCVLAEPAAARRPSPPRPGGSVS